MSEFVTWSVPPDVYFGAIVQERIDAIELDIVRLIDGLTEQAADWMKANARWQDQTGNARAGLWSDMDHVVREGVWLVLSHDVTLDYTWFLEANPKTALLGDTADHFWPVILRGAMEIARKHSD